MDLKAETHTRWLQGGESTMGGFFCSAGGKGANEAVALTRLGVGVTIVGRVGSDEMGNLLLQQAEAHQGLETSAVTRDAHASTGVAVQIATSVDGVKATVICPGANSTVGPQDVRRAVSRLPPPPRGLASLRSVETAGRAAALSSLGLAASLAAQRQLARPRGMSAADADADADADANADANGAAGESDAL